MRSQREDDPYRLIYEARKAYELARDVPKAHAHNRAVRHILKALLKAAWAADRALMDKPSIIGDFGRQNSL